MTLINIQNARVYRGSTRVFEGLHLQLPLRQSTAILGPNGAGKTTLLKLLARELYPSQGTVEILGQANWNVWELRKHLGIVSADLQNGYQPQATGRAVVLSGFYSSNNVQQHQQFTTEMIAAAESVIQRLQIEALVERPFRSLSTGQQRRFLLARALVHQPANLILDEPTAGLDLAGQFEYFETMRSLLADGRTLILVTHHVQEILPEIENVVLLKHGKVMEAGRKSEVLTSQHLSQLYDCRVQVQCQRGYYLATPG